MVVKRFKTGHFITLGRQNLIGLKLNIVKVGQIISLFENVSPRAHLQYQGDSGACFVLGCMRGNALKILKHSVERVNGVCHCFLPFTDWITLCLMPCGLLLHDLFSPSVNTCVCCRLGWPANFSGSASTEIERNHRQLLQSM